MKTPCKEVVAKRLGFTFYFDVCKTERNNQCTKSKLSYTTYEDFVSFDSVTRLSDRC